MQTYLRNSLRITAALILMVALFGSSFSAASAASLPPGPCTGAGTVTCNLWTNSGSFTPPGGVATTVWAYTDSAAGPVTAPGGPVLVVNQNDIVTVNLTNNLSETTSMFFQGQSILPDTVGVGAGGSTSYTFTASKPGTFLYEAGLAPNSQHQVAMGLYGALVVRPTTVGQAYNDAGGYSAYTDEAVVLLSELDPALNSSASPALFDMRNYKPKYYLINGLAYPNTANISVAAGNRVLLRYVNAGMQSHHMSLLGSSQSLIAQDGSPFNLPHSAVSETIAPGQTMDAVVTIPAGAANGSKFPVYDANMLLVNNNGLGTAAGFGGMLTFLAVTAPAGPDLTGPGASNLVLSPTPLSTASNVAISGNLSDVGVGDANVTAGEYFIDATGTSGTGAALSGTFGSPTVAVSATIPSATVGSLAPGNHTIYVHGQDSVGNWGSFSSVVLIITTDTVGPQTSALGFTQNPTNGTVSVTLSATASDAAAGGSNITAAEYFIDPSGTPADGTGTAMAGPFNSATIAVVSSIPAATINALSEGAHTIQVHSRDASNNWGPLASVTLNVDKTGPGTSSVVAAPSPNNGALPFNSNTQAVRVTASFADSAANLVTAEGFIDVQGANGAGFVFVSNDGLFNSLTELGYANIPLVTIKALSQGSHTILVHGKDAAGNWGPASSVTLVVDKTAPTLSGLTLTPTASNNTAVTISASASDVATGNTNITAAEFYIDVQGVAGSGTALSTGAAAPSVTVNGNISAAAVGALTAGNHTVYVHARDAAGNWGAYSPVTLLIDRTAPTFTGISLTPNSIATGTASVTLNVLGSSDGAGGSGVTRGEYWFGTSVPTAGAGTAFTGLNPTIPTSSLSAGTYTVGARIRDAAGNWSTGTGGVRTTTLTVTGPSAPLYFSTFGNSNPPGVGGTADDADIYNWNGSAFSRSIDVSTITNPLPAGANVDGFDRVDATHYYMSFNGTVTVPGIGSVQNEDVVFYNAGTWSLYFDGTPASRGLNLSDIDAISIVGGTMYFSTGDSAVPTGVAGGGDDADIYSWNGTSFARVYDATALGWSGANVDGFVRIDATHFYISYNADIFVTGPGTAQDEDVLYYNNGVWSIYFDGTSKGLTSGDLDVDAFDLP